MDRKLLQQLVQLQFSPTNVPTTAVPQLNHLNNKLY